MYRNVQVLVNGMFIFEYDSDFEKACSLLWSIGCEFTIGGLRFLGVAEEYYEEAKDILCRNKVAFSAL